MNQILKTVVYGKGSPDQIRFMARTGGMTEEEQRLLELLHQNKSDIFIEQELAIDHKTFLRIEESVRAKITIAVFHCIDFAMWNEQ